MNYSRAWYKDFEHQKTLSIEEAYNPVIVKAFRHYLTCREIETKIGGTQKQEILDFWPEDDGVTLTYVFKYDNGNIEEGCASVKYFELEKFIQHINA